MARGQNPTYELTARTPKAAKQNPKEGSETGAGPHRLGRRAGRAVAAGPSVGQRDSPRGEVSSQPTGHRQPAAVRGENHTVTWETDTLLQAKWVRTRVTGWKGNLINPNL